MNLLTAKRLKIIYKEVCTYSDQVQHVCFCCVCPVCALIRNLRRNKEVPSSPRHQTTMRKTGEENSHRRTSRTG